MLHMTGTLKGGPGATGSVSQGYFIGIVALNKTSVSSIFVLLNTDIRCLVITNTQGILARFFSN